MLVGIPPAPYMGKSYQKQSEAPSFYVLLIHTSGSIPYSNEVFTANECVTHSCTEI